MLRVFLECARQRRPRAVEVAAAQLSIGERSDHPDVAAGGGAGEPPDGGGRVVQATRQRANPRGECAGVRVRRERDVVHQRLPRRLEVALTFGGRRIDKKRRRVDGEARRRLLQRAFGGIEIPFLLERATVQRERLARRGGRRCDALERFVRLAQERAIVARTLEPDWPSAR